MNAPSKLSLTAALSWIFFSTLLISGSAWTLFAIYKGFFNFRAQDARYNIVAFVQAANEREPLNTTYLAELLSLSIDQPKNLYAFDLKEGEKKLLASPLIKTCALKRIPPGTLYLDYTLHQPYAFLSDCSNTAITKEGYLLPFAPFFSPKKLPKVYLGQIKANWGKKVDDAKWSLALRVMEALNSAQINLLEIDVSSAFAESFGQRQIILTIEKADHKIYIRLPVKNFTAALERFMLLNLKDFDQPVYTIDLRIENLAFYQPHKE